MPSPTPSSSDADRNLLFGVLALQAGLIATEQFIEACTLWSTRKTVPLADLLVARGWILPEDKHHLDYLLDRNLRKHGGDASATLGALPPALKDSLVTLQDADIQRSLSSGSPSTSAPLLSTLDWLPEALPRYQRSHLHATGGIGRVWFTQDRQLGRAIALKELRPDKADDPGTVARFLREAQITGQLEHPGVVPVYEVACGPAAGQPFYTMRFVRGRTLAEAARVYHRERPAAGANSLELLALLSAFVAVCNTVAYAHARGVIHRDLKGQNVVVGDFGEVVVLDWGLAKIVGRPEGEGEAPPVTLPHGGSADADLTVHGQMLGTPGYMAPEQAAGRLEAIDYRTDVYGLGAILYEILTGRPPFTGSSREEVLRKVRDEEPLPPCRLWPAAPPALEAACLRALAKATADRYPSPSALAREVQHWQELQRRQAEDALKQANAELARSNEQLKQLAADLEERAASELRAHQELLEVQQRQVAQAEQLARLGRMVAGVTYEIQNPLSAAVKDITSLQRDTGALCELIRLYQQAEESPLEHRAEAHHCVRLFTERIDLPARMRSTEDLLTRSRNSLLHIRQIIKDFREFGNLDESPRAEVDLNAAIEPAVNIARSRTQRLAVQLEVELTPVPPVQCYPAEVNQVVLNLLNNAIDACASGGRVTLRTCPGPEGLEIHVLDTGPGIDPTIRDRIFDPFFTTKPSGLGRGLGLSISSVIVRKHGGRIEVESVPGQGAQFVVRLPLRPPEEATRLAGPNGGAVIPQ
ncbi:MAG: ATP-binding protein [Gemmataceae bacterium]|nr:ATP-binding protein [Gemmataceae bacterium]